MQISEFYRKTLEPHKEFIVFGIIAGVIFTLTLQSLVLLQRHSIVVYYVLFFILIAFIAKPRLKLPLRFFVIGSIVGLAFDLFSWPYIVMTDYIWFFSVLPISFVEGISKLLSLDAFLSPVSIYTLQHIAVPIFYGTIFAVYARRRHARNAPIKVWHLVLLVLLSGFLGFGLQMLRYYILPQPDIMY